MKSKGRHQGFQCVKCGNTAKSKTRIKIPRKIREKIYLPDLSAHRHLSRPPIRIGKINKPSKFYENGAWFSVYNN